MAHCKTHQGFTLIELALVLVIIGLVVGGVLVGRDLVSAAAVRAQIAQIDRYQAAMNTFKGKYGYLPADIPNPDAPRFGFQSRAGVVGDADGLINPLGEGVIAWVDLSTARLIDGGFSRATVTGGLNVSGGGGGVDLDSTPAVNAFIPTAKISDNYINIFNYNSINYFGLGRITQFYWSGVSGYIGQGPTVAQAFSIDTKLDDGMPTTGNVKTWHASGSSVFWDNLTGAPANIYNDPASIAIAPNTNLCFDNGNTAGVTPQYSITFNNGSNARCALAFKFQ